MRNFICDTVVITRTCVTRPTVARRRRAPSVPEHPADLSASRATAIGHRRGAQRRRLLDILRCRLLGAGRMRVQAAGDLPRLHVLV